MANQVLSDPGTELAAAQPDFAPAPVPVRQSNGSIMFGRYQLLSQLSAGRDGLRYQARDPEAPGLVELVALSTAEDDPARERERAKRLRSAALLMHATARRVLDLRLEHAPPFVVLEAGESPAATEAAPRSWPEAVAAACKLAAGLAEGHRFGLAHGRIDAAVAFPGGSVPKLDWTNLDVGPLPLPPAAGPSSPFLAPERRNGARPSPAADVYALGILLIGWITGQWPPGPGAAMAGDSEPLGPLLTRMLAEDPSERPPAREVAGRLASHLNSSAITQGISPLTDNGAITTAFAPDDHEPEGQAGDPGLGRERLGRFLLHEKIGQGGMGSVYRGEDLGDGTLVAIKVLRKSWAKRPEALRRLYKEARLLAEANNPYVTNLIEVNEDEGIHYLALEFIRGRSLGAWLKRRGRLDEPTALAIMADVARGLAVAHERGIIHRDIKPENVLLIESDADVEAEFASPPSNETTAAASAPAPPPQVKVSDFGLARHIEETESLNLTQAGMIVGTPLYMSPEQCSGRAALGPPADVYAMGALLFHLLAARPPFEADTTVALIAKHQGEPPPALKEWNEAASDGVAQVVAKALAKKPEERYADAGEMLLDLERLLRGEPTGINIHPRLPACDPRELVRFDFQWELEASPRQLWPHVSNTERLNRALGLSAVTFTTEFDPEEGVKRFGRFRTSGLQVGWREYPFEWVEGRRMGVFREFSQGPFQWFVSTVELAPRLDGGTTLTHSIRIASKTLLGRTLAHVKLGNQGRRSMDQIYRRIDAALTGKLGNDSLADPFESAPALARDRRRRLDQWLETLGPKGIDPLVVERLGDFLTLAPAQEVARIRPLALARRLGLSADQVVAACLHGAKDGALVMLWDLLCPICRIPSEVVGNLRALRDHGHCEACHLDYELDFANSVELIFRAHPEIRETELGTFCIGGPAHSPHVAAQVRISPKERVALDLALDEGSYRLRGPQLAYSIDFRVEPGASAKRWDLTLSRAPGPRLPRALKTGGQQLALSNDTDRELVVRIERTAPRDDAFTAARASALALFRTLFPGEILSPGQFVNLTTVTLMVTEMEHAGDLYRELGDARAFALVHEHFRHLDEAFRRHGGALIKTVNEGSVAVFSDPVAAVDAALALVSGEGTGERKLRVGIHRGPAMVATFNDHLDYFGATVNVAMRLPRLARGGEVVLSQAVAADPGVSARLQGQGLTLAIIPAALTGLAEDFAHRVGPARSERES